VAVPQNTNVRQQPKANIFENTKPDSKPKWFSPWIRRR
jgi:hypothetical protein